MAVKIRLSRIGKKSVPFYRIIATDSRKKRDGACLDNLGTYDALNGTVVAFHKERYDEWVTKGAEVTDSAKKIYKKFKDGQKSTENSASSTKKVAAPKKAVAVEAPKAEIAAE